MMPKKKAARWFRTLHFLPIIFNKQEFLRFLKLCAQKTRGDYDSVKEVNYLFLKTISVWVSCCVHESQKSPQFISYARLQQSQTQLRCFDSLLQLPFIWKETKCGQDWRWKRNSILGRNKTDLQDRNKTETENEYFGCEIIVSLSCLTQQIQNGSMYVQVAS